MGEDCFENFNRQRDIPRGCRELRDRGARFELRMTARSPERPQVLSDPRCRVSILGILMRAMFGHGTPRRPRVPDIALLFVVQPNSHIGDRRDLGRRPRNGNARNHHRTSNGSIKIATSSPGC